MGFFVKVVKNKAYYKRYQTKFRRRREGKTDYQQRKALIMQDNNKYNTKKYRFVVRISKSRILCQVIYAKVNHDVVLCEASSQELKRYGLTAGLTNYPASYCTGLLLARRLLKQVGMDTMFNGQTNVDGKKYSVTWGPQPDRRPFKAVLDVGLRRTTTGNRVFGALKGACDGGLHIPHHTRRFPGSSKNNKRSKCRYDAEVHRGRIFGEHVQTWTDSLWNEDDDGAVYKKRFARWNACLDANDTEQVSEIYQKVHEAIRSNPDRVKKERKHVKHKVVEVLNMNQVIYQTANGNKYRRDKKLTNAQRKQRVQTKLELYAQMKQQEEEESDEEEDESDE